MTRFELASAITQLETPSVRVTRWDFPPGTETGDHQHEYDYVVVPLTNGVLTITTPEHEPAENPIELGASYQREAGVIHNVQNASDHFVSFVEIELLEHPMGVE